MRRPVAAVLARPKSRIFRVQSDLTTMLLGFRSCPDTQYKFGLEDEAQDVSLKEESARHSRRTITDCKHIVHTSITAAVYPEISFVMKL